MLTASILFVFTLEEAGTRFAWGSGAVIASLIFAVLLLVGFVTWEMFLERKGAVQEPIFPMRLLKNRLLVGMLLWVVRNNMLRWSC